jgi:hypothetical protein
VIDHRFSRMAFESLRTNVERQQLARELAEELRAHIARAPDPDNGLSAAIARLRLIGHHLYAEGDPAGDRLVYAGDPGGDEPPTGLELEVRGGALVETRYRVRERR